MTERLYYNNSFLYDFVAALLETRTIDGRVALVLDRTAFYPTSGGQVFDTGWLDVEPLEGSEQSGLRPKLRVIQVEETEAGEVLHFIDSISDEAALPNGDIATRVRGFIDVERRRDHMQQHSGQHVLSAAFVEQFQMPTVSFHMGDETCTIDIDAKSLSPEQACRVEARANEVIWEDRPVDVKEATPEEAREMGVRKIPKDVHDKLRLINIREYDLCGCGGTHVRSTGQIGAIQIRKIEKVKQGVRVEFVCGKRALQFARKDFEVLSSAASKFSSHLWDVPDQIAKLQDEAKAASKREQLLKETVAQFEAGQLLADVRETEGERRIIRVFDDRDMASIRLLAQKLTAASSNTVVLLAASVGQPAVVFAQSAGMQHDMGTLMKQAMSALGSRGGGSKDLAQGGVLPGANLQQVLETAASQLRH